MLGSQLLVMCQHLQAEATNTHAILVTDISLKLMQKDRKKLVASYGAVTKCSRLTPRMPCVFKSIYILSFWAITENLHPASETNNIDARPHNASSHWPTSPGIVVDAKPVTAGLA